MDPGPPLSGPGTTVSQHINKTEAEILKLNKKNWLKFYLSKRTFGVSIRNYESKLNKIICRVRQGSIRGPLLFDTYMFPLSQIVQEQDRVSQLC